jgi:Reverse transcriptase (RNA-dependent DNA polymerase)
MSGSLPSFSPDVDDFLIFYKHGEELSTPKDHLNEKFKMKDLGPVKGCLGIRITSSEGGNTVKLDQKAYIDEILKKFGMQDCKPVSTPSDTNQKLSIKDVTPANEITGTVPYQEAVGSLLYLSQSTRPDIAFSVNDVSRFNGQHAETH